MRSMNDLSNSGHRDDPNSLFPNSRWGGKSIRGYNSKKKIPRRKKKKKKNQNQQHQRVCRCVAESWCPSTAQPSLEPPRRDRRIPRELSKRCISALQRAKVVQRAKVDQRETRVPGRARGNDSLAMICSSHSPYW